MKKLLVGMMCFAAAGCAQATYSLGPESRPQDGVPKGTVTRGLKLDPGKFYPGTPHSYDIYVPAQYDASKPTPFMIFLDGGGGLNAPVVFDNLIARKELPPLIGIFIQPGVLPALSPDAQSRYERIYEYDSQSDVFSRFLLEELIPTVGKQYNLSRNPDDHAIEGVSTGAVGAFVAAWQRPDQFHRVLSFIGTFVSMKGADALPALIRKTEAKPIRIFLQDGKNDHLVPTQPYGTFFAGSWPINNEVMYEAFESAGYDVKLEIGDGGHDTRQAAAIMPDAIRWLWRDYPAPIVPHDPPAMKQPGWDPRGKASSIVSIDAPWEQVGEMYGPVSSPAAAPDGSVYFADPSANRIYKSDAAGKVTLFKDNTNGARALAMGPDGRLYASQPARKRIVYYGPAGDEKALADSVEAGSLAVSAKSGVYFADTAHKTVSYIAAGSQPHVVYSGNEIALPSAVALSPDQAMLLVADQQSRYSWSFQIAADGSLINGEAFYRLEMPETGWMSGTVAAAEDTTGQVYFGTALGIQVCEANGRLSAILNPPEHGTMAGFVFGGKELNWLYAAEGGKLFRRPVKVKGVASWSVVKPPKPPL